MPFHKITKSFNTIDEPNRLYFGCQWEEREDGVYADVPEYAVESYVECGRVHPIEEKKAEAPKVKVVAPEDKSAEDVVTGNTVDAVEKKEARAEKAEAEKIEEVKPKVEAPEPKAKPKAKVKSKSKSKGK